MKKNEGKELGEKKRHFECFVYLFSSEGLRYCLSLFFLVFITVWTTAQQPFFKNYEVRDGLPSNNVYYVFQDSEGYVWFCTDLGVSRFDGIRFTNFTTANGLSDNEIFSCYEDKVGRLWFATLNGKPCFYEDGIMHDEHNTPLLQNFSLDGLIFNIYQEENGSIVLASSNKMGQLDFIEKKANIIPFSKMSIKVWNETGDTIGLFDDKHIGYFINGKQILIDSVPIVSKPLKFNVSGDTLFMTDVHNLLIYNRKERKIVSRHLFPKSMGEVIAIHVMGNKIWIGSRNGAYLLNRKDLSIQQVYFPKSKVSAILEDREGGWWFSTLNNGVFYIPVPDILQIIPQEKKPLGRVNCLSVAPDGKLWLGLNENQFGVYTQEQLRLYDHFPEKITARAITTIRHLQDGTTILAGKAGTILTKNAKSQFLFIPSTDITFDQDGNVWSALAGLYFVPAKNVDGYKIQEEHLNAKEVDIKRFYKKTLPTQMLGFRIERLGFDYENILWLASPNGLFFYENDQLSAPVLPYNIRDFEFNDSKTILWILTESNGLFAFQDGEVLDSIPIVSRGGDAKICLGFCRDTRGDFWIATASGLCKIEGTIGHFNMLDYSNVHGLGAEKINAVAVFDGQVFMGKDDGLVSIPLSIFSKKTTPPPIYIKKLTVNGKNESLSQQLDLNADQNALSFSFEGLSFKDYKNLTYRYRLLGKESTWHTTTSERVEYASLQPGEYTFEVFAENSSGVESVEPATLAFFIAKPFWSKWWFLLSMFVSTIGLVLFWVSYRERKMRQKYEYQQRLVISENDRLELQKKNVDLRMLALRLQMNPHFIFNALNTIKGYYGQDKFTEANSYIAKFARLLRLNLDYSDSFIPLEQEIELLKIYMQLSQIRYPEKIVFDIKIAPDISPSSILIPSMTIQPFVENAIIHGIVTKQGTGHLNLGFSKENEEIVVTIIDDGIGRIASAKISKLRDPHKPLATPITRERLQLLRKKQIPPAIEIVDIYHDSGQAAGTKVILRLPLNLFLPFLSKN